MMLKGKGEGKMHSEVCGMHSVGKGISMAVI